MKADVERGGTDLLEERGGKRTGAGKIPQGRGERKNKTIRKERPHAVIRGKFALVELSKSFKEKKRSTTREKLGGVCFRFKGFVAAAGDPLKNNKEERSWLPKRKEEEKAVK